jgi:hypothetical protein
MAVAGKIFVGNTAILKLVSKSLDVSAKRQTRVAKKYFVKIMHIFFAHRIEFRAKTKTADQL